MSEGSCTILRNGSSYSLEQAFERRELLYPTPPSVGVVVGTFAALPFIHLQLEARQRFYPSVLLLVHDDSSHKGEELAALCASYGADYERNEPRLARFRGDLTIFVAASAGRGRIRSISW